jgi:threonine aldolase
LVELPTREAGGLLPSWAELKEIKEAAKNRDIRLHLDGARLWECGPAYEKSYAEICDGFDSAYVSFYKGVGALPGAMLLGPEDFVAEAVIWQRRTGGNLYTLTPNVASAAMQFESRLARMPALLERARQMARVLASINGLTVKPEPPHVNMFHLFLHLEVDAAIEARNRVAEEFGLWAFGWVAPTEIPGTCRTEIYVGEAAMNVSDADIDDAFRSLMLGS